MNNVGLKIRKIREEKGVTQEAMALELDITQSNYGRLEKDDRRLTVPKVLKIAEVLNVSISHIFNEQASKVIHQLHNQSPAAYNVENLYQENKEAYEKLNEQYELRIKNLEEEAIFLKEIISQNKK